MKKEIVEHNKILEIRVGSHLYGTSTPTSDEDFSGVFIPPKSYYFGLDKVEEADLSIVSRLENGRNAPDAIDRKFYELRKFVKLAMDNNPNIIEQLFVEEENIIFIRHQGRELLNNRHLFLHKGLEKRFKGYAISQKKKMFVKRDNMLDIEAGLRILQEMANDTNPKAYLAEHLVGLLGGIGSPFKAHSDLHINIGDIHVQKNITFLKAIEQLENRVSKFSGRKEMVDEFGYDTKFGMHLIRLLLEGKELLETGTLNFPLKNVDLLMGIRNGHYSLNEVDEMATEIEIEIDNMVEKSYLPSSPNYNEINTMLVEMLDFWEF